MHKINTLEGTHMDQWQTFSSRVTQFPWDRAAYLVTNEQTHSDLVHLLASYEQLRVDSKTNLPHGQSLFEQFDKVFAGLPSAPRET